MITRILVALIYVQTSITMPNLAVIQLMRVIKWPRSDSDGSCVNINVRGNKGFYSITLFEADIDLRRIHLYSNKYKVCVLECVIVK